MSIFGNIVSAIFGGAKSAASAITGGAAATAETTAAGAPATGKPMTRAEVEAMIQKLADQSKEKNLDWRRFDRRPDEAAQARQQPEVRASSSPRSWATPGALNGSAEMNVWLHKQVMTKLAESGGVVPDSLK